MAQAQVLEQSKIKEPKMFKVILLNDETTTMDFVIEILMDIFHHDFNNASKIMLEIHHQGSGICGIYSQDLALSKQKQVNQKAKLAGFPLKTKVEEE